MNVPTRGPTAPKRWAYRSFVAFWCAMRPVLRWLNRHAATYCPVCESPSRFLLRQGNAPGEVVGAVCPICFSRPRHRASWLFIRQATNLADGTPKRFLHLAPEMEFSRRFKATAGLDYLSADLAHPGAMRSMDLTDIDWPDASFDVIYCSHMLEHIPADRAAMAELHRVLRPGGWALVQVPIDPGHPTREDLSITDPKVRERLYGQWDHVRYYGMDIGDRLREAGFEVRVVNGADIAGAQERRQMEIAAGEPLFFCTRPGAGNIASRP